MADQNATNQNPGNTEDRDKQNKGQAMGAGASGGYQGQPGQQQGQGEDPGGASQRNETAGQGGGIQGTGQSQANPGGYTGGQGSTRDENRGDKGGENKGEFGQGQGKER